VTVELKEQIELAQTVFVSGILSYVTLSIALVQHNATDTGYISVPTAWRAVSPRCARDKTLCKQWGAKQIGQNRHENKKITHEDA